MEKHNKRVLDSGQMDLRSWLETSGKFQLANVAKNGITYARAENGVWSVKLAYDGHTYIRQQAATLLLNRFVNEYPGMMKLKKENIKAEVLLPTVYSLRIAS